MICRITGIFLSSILFASAAQASLTSSFQFNGTGNWSIDAIGEFDSPNIGDLRAFVPSGSTVEKAFLYQTTFDNTSPLSLSFGGVVLGPTDWTSLGTTTPADLTAFRADVTDQVATAVGGGDDVNPFTFSVVESNTRTQDGAMLVVVYSNPNEAERTIGLLDGFTEPSGDTTSVNLADPLTADQLADPDFEAQLSLGIGFGFQGNGQFSTVDINGQRLTTSAGGQDDGEPANGALITVGDTFDDDFTTNPADPFATPNGDPRYDDEAYNLTPLLAAGTDSIQIDTANPSFDDNIFFAGINITAVAGVNQDPPDTTQVPEPAPLLLMGLGLTGLAWVRRRRG